MGDPGNLHGIEELTLNDVTLGVTRVSVRLVQQAIDDAIKMGFIFYVCKFTAQISNLENKLFLAKETIYAPNLNGPV